MNNADGALNTRRGPIFSENLAKQTAPFARCYTGMGARDRRDHDIPSRLCSAAKVFQRRRNGRIVAGRPPCMQKLDLRFFGR